MLKEIVLQRAAMKVRELRVRSGGTCRPQPKAAASQPKPNSGPITLPGSNLLWRVLCAVLRYRKMPEPLYRRNDNPDPTGHARLQMRIDRLREVIVEGRNPKQADPQVRLESIVARLDEAVDLALYRNGL